MRALNLYLSTKAARLRNARTTMAETEVDGDRCEDVGEHALTLLGRLITNFYHSLDVKKLDVYTMTIPWNQILVRLAR
jgi:hypothetical protein